MRTGRELETREVGPSECDTVAGGPVAGARSSGSSEGGHYAGASSSGSSDGEPSAGRHAPAALEGWREAGMSEAESCRLAGAPLSRNDVQREASESEFPKSHSAEGGLNDNEGTSLSGGTFAPHVPTAHADRAVTGSSERRQVGGR